MLKHDYPLARCCGVLGLARSAYYYRAVPTQETQLLAAIEQIGAQFPTYGTRRVREQVKREQPALAPLNRKRVQRVMREKDLLVLGKKRVPRTTDSRHAFPRYPNLVQELAITHPDKVWVCDITYIVLRSECVYLAVIMDVYTRCIRGWQLGRNLEHTLTLGALQTALKTHQPEIHHSDQGVQYAAHPYVEVLTQAQIQISMAEVGQSQQNGYAERVIRTIKEEAVYLSQYQNYEEALEQIGHFIDDVYLTKRIHSALGYLTPAEYEAQWQKQLLASIL